MWSEPFGKSSHPLGPGGGVRPQIVLNNLKINVMSKSLDLSYTPGDGFRQTLSGWVSPALLSCAFMAGDQRVSKGDQLVSEWSRTSPGKAAHLHTSVIVSGDENLL